MKAQRERCSGVTKTGDPCGSFAVRDGLCVSHHPEMSARRAEGSRKGGQARSNARRAARLWAAAGEAMRPEDMPAILRSCMIAVRDGRMEPNQASAIAQLARASLSLTNEIEIEARFARLEEAAGLAETPSNVRRIA